MKRFTTFLVFAIAVLLSLPSHARVWNWAEHAAPEYVFAGQQVGKQLVRAQLFTDNRLQPQSRTQKKGEYSVPRRAAGVTPPSSVVPVTYYTTSGAFYLNGQSGFEDATADMASVEVAIDGNTMYVQGLAYWFKEAWVKGTINGTTVTFENQYIAEDSYGPEYLVGTNDGSAVAENIVFTFDATNGLLSAVTPLILESAAIDQIQPYAYWSSPVFSKQKPAEPEAVVLPEGAVLKEYSLSYTDYNGKAATGKAAVAVVGDDVYFQGFSSYLSDALILGKKQGDSIVVADNQYLGIYSNYKAFLVKGGVFYYDAENDTYSAQGDIYSLLNNQYIDVYATNPVLKGVVEKAVVPANPTITQIKASQYGDILIFNVPTVDVDGNGLITSKLSFQIYSDIEKEISPVTFKAGADYIKLTQDMTVIPYGFTEGYDFYKDQIYLNLDHSTWNKVGIKSIYTGGGEVNETEIQWYTIKPYAYEQAVSDLTTEVAKAEVLLGENTFAAAVALKNAIDEAKALLENTEATVEQLNAALKNLKDAELTFTQVLTARTNLANEIAAAEALKTEGNTNGLDAFNAIINDAKAALASDTSSVDELNAALTLLQSAEQAFKAANGFSVLTWEVSKQGFTNNQEVENVIVNDIFTLTFAKNEGSTAPTYYSSGTNLRLYDKNTLTVTASDKVSSLTKIILTQSSTTYGSKLVANVGEITKTGANVVWVGDAKEVVFTNNGTTQSRIKTISFEYQAALSDLMKEAKALAIDADAVAVGKLLDAIAAAEASGDESGLQAAIDQFKADNKDQEADQTSKVSVDVAAWKGASGFVGWAGDPITTYDGRNTPLVENFNGSTGAATGEIFSQTITGLSKGTYKVAFYANANSTADRDAAVETGMADGADDVAYVFANNAQKFIVAHRALDLKTFGNGLYSFEMELTDADNGTIKLGMGKEKAGTNWHSMQIFQLTWFTTAKQVYATLKTDMVDAIAAAKAAKTADRTNGAEEFDAAIAAAEAALKGNKLNVSELETAIATLKTATTDFIKANYVEYNGVAYVIDAETGKAMAAGHNYGTRGIVNEDGLDLTFAFNADTRKVTIDTRVANKNDHFLGSNLYMDAAAAEWALEAHGKGFYITNGTQYISVDAEDNLVMSDTPRTWNFVSVDDMKAQRLRKLAAANEENGVDATFLLQNPNFNRNDQRVNAWTVVATNSNLNGGNQTNNCAESYHSGNGFTISQIVEGAPAGKYTLTAQGFYRQDDGVVEETPVFFANEATAEVPVKTGEEGSMSAASESFSNGLYTIEPIEFEVDSTGTLTVGVKTTGEHQWVIFDNFKLTYYGSKNAPVVPELKTYTYSFAQDLNGWTTIDADKDGYAWERVYNENCIGHDGNKGVVTSASYVSQKVLTPDNYLVSPKMKLDGKIKFYASAQDAQYPDEHFGVAVSTASGTNALDFEMVTEEWTMGASRGGNIPAKVVRRAQGNWYEYEVDLSGFYGAEGYVAIRHFNCSDKFRLNVDDITLETSELIDAYDPQLEVLPAEPTPVVLPEGAEVVAYTMNYTDKDNKPAGKPVNVAVVADTVYFQGMSDFLPEAWVKGVKNGNEVVFKDNQLLGTYSTQGQSYFFYNGVTVFTYDAEADTYSATGEIYGVLNNQYYDGRYFNPVLSRVVEVAGKPATPSISGIEETQYGDVLLFNVPLTDVNGNNMVASKLSYQFFVDDEANQLVFTTQDYIKLTEDMTVIPFGFTENYDFYADEIYLNMPHDTWTKIGIQSVYTGGGETNKSDIFWFTMPVKELPVAAPEGLETEDYIFAASAIAADKAEEGAKPYTAQVKVGFDGNDVYIQGLATDEPEFWVKATKNETGKYVIPANQYMGEFSFWGYTFPYYWTAVDATGKFEDTVLDFDAQTNTFKTNQILALNGAKDSLDYYLLYTDVTISKFIEVAATPANPTLNSFELSEKAGLSKIKATVPTVGTNGEALNLNKLYYTIWIEKNGVQQPYTFFASLYGEDFDDDVVEVPYTHNEYDVYTGGEVIYLEDDLDELNSWTKVGIQSIYYGLGERRVSSIVWSDGTTDTDTTVGIKSVANDTDARFFDLQGRAINGTQKGLIIKQVRNADGKVNTVKVVRK